MKKRAKGGAFGGPETQENNGEQEGGKPRMIDPAAKAAKLAKKTTGEGFARGGATDEDGIARKPAHKEDKGRKDGGRIDGEKSMGNLAKRARGGGVFSAAGKTSDRDAKSESGHEGE